MRKRILFGLGLLLLHSPALVAAPAARRSPAAVPPAAPVSLSPEQQLGKEMAELRAGSSIGTVAIEGRRLRINGSEFIDPEGELAGITIDPQSGDATYTIRQDRHLVLKFVSARNPDRQIVLGTLQGTTQGGYKFESVTGVRIAGRHTQVQSDGIMLWRDNVVFLYRAGQGMMTYTLPDGYYPAEQQHGELNTTSVMMIRRTTSTNTSGFGSIVGVLKGKQYFDFSLFDLASGKKVDLPFESTPEQDQTATCTGSQRYLHYYCLADWLRVGNRRFAAYFSKGMQEISIVDLDTGVSKLAMQRKRGWSNFELRNNDTGGIKLVVTSNSTIPDIVAWYDGNGAVVQ